jgi:hypothetical protein|tara:strand:- start:2327 stop:2452 length:126 start_codon:yes stop_codon:yes gene_type:complete
MKDDQFYNSEEDKENSSSDANVALVMIICGVIAASIYVSSL